MRYTRGINHNCRNRRVNEIIKTDDSDNIQLGVLDILENEEEPLAESENNQSFHDIGFIRLGHI